MAHAIFDPPERLASMFSLCSIFINCLLGGDSKTMEKKIAA